MPCTQNRIDQARCESSDWFSALVDLADSGGTGDTSAGTVNIRKAVNYGNLSSFANRQAALAAIDAAVETIRSASGHFVTNMTLLNTRLDFTQSYANTLSAGASKLTLADINEEGANMLAMQSRTQLSAQALSFVSKSEQDILGLFR